MLTSSISDGVKIYVWQFTKPIYLLDKGEGQGVRE